MPGSSILTAVVPISNRRHIFPTGSCTCTYDAEIYIGDGNAGQPRYIKSVVHHVVPSDEKEPEEGTFCFISGKVASIEPHTFFGNGFPAEEYDLEIDAFVFYQMSSCRGPSPAVVTVSGLTGQQVTSHEFYLNVTQYVVKESKTAAHRVHLPECSRLRNTTLQTGAQVSIIGRITAAAEEVSSECAVKRLPIEVHELVFLTGGTCPPSTAVKGKSPAWGSWGKSTPAKTSSAG